MLVDILASERNESGYIENLENVIKEAKKVLKRDKHRVLLCSECGDDFLQHDKRQVFCSKKCATSARVKRFRASQDS